MTSLCFLKKSTGSSFPKTEHQECYIDNDMSIKLSIAARAAFSRVHLMESAALLGILKPEWGEKEPCIFALIVYSTDAVNASDPFWDPSSVLKC